MYENSGSNSNNGKMATAKNQSIKYKSISGRLKEHFGFKLLATVISKMLTTSIAFNVTNRSHTMDLTRRLLTTFKRNTCYTIHNFSLQRQLHLASSQRQHHILPSKLL